MNPWVSVSIVIETVTTAFGELELGRRQTRRQSLCWRVVYHLAYVVSGASLPEIGKACKRDHTTVLAGIRTLKAEMRKNIVLRDAVKTLEARLHAYRPEAMPKRAKVAS